MKYKYSNLRLSPIKKTKCQFLLEMLLLNLIPLNDYSIITAQNISQCTTTEWPMPTYKKTPNFLFLWTFLSQKFNASDLPAELSESKQRISQVKKVSREMIHFFLEKSRFWIKTRVKKVLTNFWKSLSSLKTETLEELDSILKGKIIQQKMKILSQKIQKNNSEKWNESMILFSVSISLFNHPCKNSQKYSYPYLRRSHWLVTNWTLIPLAYISHPGF